MVHHRCFATCKQAKREVMEYVEIFQATSVLVGRNPIAPHADSVKRIRRNGIAPYDFFNNDFGRGKRPGV